MQMILRAVIPARAVRTDHKRNAKDPVRGIGNYSGKLERRLQVIIADMLRSTWLDPVSKEAATIPTYPDYKYAISTIAHLGGTEACEAIYREIKDVNMKAGQTAGRSLLPYRLEALKVWMTGRVKYSSWTRNRPGALAPPNPPKSSSRYRPDQEIKDPASYAISVLWSILGELSQARSISASTPLYKELVVTLHQFLRLLPETEVTVADTARKILKQALEKGYGIDFKFLRQDPAFTAAITPDIVESVIYLMGSQGDIWRMVAMYESLTGAEFDPEVAGVVDGAAFGEGEDVGETLSAALQAEAASRSSLDWLGRQRAQSSAAVPIVDISCKLSFSSCSRKADSIAPVTQAEYAPIPSAPRLFDHFLPSATSLSDVSQLAMTPTTDSHEAAASTVPLPTLSTLVTTSQVTTMMHAIKRADNVDLAVHVLRIALRDAAQVQTMWLDRALRSTVQPASPVLSAASEPSDSASTADVSTATTQEAASVDLPSRLLLVSARWFDDVHVLARTGSNAIWAANEVRQLMETEIESLSREHLLLTGTSIEDSIEETGATAPINLINSRRAGNHQFDPARHLRYLRRTYGELTRMMAVSVQQQERRREVTRAKNARRAERAAEAAKAEQEKIEAKQASRRRRDEMHEAPLALA
jgi:hypothetical protein